MLEDVVMAHMGTESTLMAYSACEAGRMAHMGTETTHMAYPACECPHGDGEKRTLAKLSSTPAWGWTLVNEVRSDALCGIS